MGNQSNFSANALGDEELISLIRDDNHTAFTELFHRYWKKLLFIAAHKLKETAAAEEIVQDILADVWTRRQTIKITTTVNAYLSVALKYKIIDYLAKQNNRAEYVQYITSHAETAEHTTENWLRFEELRHRLELSIRELPEKCEIVYRMSKEKGLNNKQIAEKQKISEKTVEAHLTRAVKLLRQKLTIVIFLHLL